MQVLTPSGSEPKATTTHRHLQAVAQVGGALIGFLVMKTPAARKQLENAASTACQQGELSETDAAVVQRALANQPNTIRN
ncbi:hypothetical protein DZC75_20410 [Pseudomonas parafulva]|uniref:Uncharacterized protein n=1 Tax=Pseudomonas parafulva TaxID=157782 RepID=A0AAI8PD85_9PSED|nr:MULTISPECIES: hypothetical protein [Pseudomonas]AXO90241.1 hypothetical protein DZC75_20410 [Pseudomonas parafulva]MDV9030506.1 hypothetical protein [Pseudomonas sp. RAC1]